MEKIIGKLEDYKSALSKALHSLRNRSAFRTTQAFIEDIAKGIHTVVPTVNSWYYGKTFPEMDNLLRLCNHFDCDLDYLLGRIDKTKHDIAFICKETHLSEPAVRQLMKQQSKMTDLFKNTNTISYRPIHDAVDNLLSDERGLEILKTIGYYLYSSDLTLYLNGEPTTEQLTLQNKYTMENYPFPRSNYDAVQLLSIQTKLAELRSELLKKS